LRRARRSPGIPQIEKDVRRDIGTANIVVMVLGGLLIFGAVAFFLGGGMEAVTNSFDSAIATIIILVCVMLAGLAAIAIGSRNKVVYAVSAGVGGMLLGSAAVVVVVLMFIAALCSGLGSACKVK
jgi:hypothetical protein